MHTGYPFGASPAQDPAVITLKLPRGHYDIEMMVRLLTGWTCGELGTEPNMKTIVPFVPQASNPTGLCCGLHRPRLPKTNLSDMPKAGKLCERRVQVPA
jgi:hypothetical protein